MTYGTTREPTTAPQRGGAAERRTGGVETTGQLRTLPSLSPFLQGDGDADQAVTGGFVLELPRPPSVNRFVKNLGNKSPTVKKWFSQCDRLIMFHRPKPVGIKSWFDLEVIVDEIFKGRVDLDNLLKALLDYLQRIELIENDKFLNDLHITWGPALGGCIVRARPWGAA